MHVCNTCGIYKYIFDKILQCFSADYIQTSEQEQDIHTKKINFCVVGEFFFSLRDINKELTAIYRAHDE